ncbi:MAG: NAD(P)/FAD-dependent oxidoreductase, partial [Acidimicrobiia bacterium]|nr:NAD(P)/FAD-dependent oxidoreductase [Acidimicrobiia bacterium]
GLTWVNPPAAVAHPLDDEQAAVVWRNLDQTASELGPDAEPYRDLFEPARRHFDELLDVVMSPIPGMLETAVRHARVMARLGPALALPASVLVRRFSTEHGKAILAGHAAHSIAPLSAPLTSGFGLVLGASAHTVGWPFPVGGAGEIVRVLTEVLAELGGEIHTDTPVSDFQDLPPTRSVLFAVTPRQLLAMEAGSGRSRFSRRYRRRLQRFRYGPGVCKVDFDLSEPVPWACADVTKAPTVHIGGTFDEIADAEAVVARGRHPRRPFVLAAQHTLFDPGRATNSAADAKHTLWTYCHVPHGSTIDMSGAIEVQIERFAPGFRDTIVRRRTWLPADLEAVNANLVGGDVAGGSNVGLRALLRPGLSPWPYRTDVPSYFIGSASTPPGAGVHGMAGHQAALDLLDFLA